MINHRYRYTLVLVFFYGAVLPALVRAQAISQTRVCDLSLLDEANRLYDLDYWSQAIAMLEPCPPKEFATTDQRIRAHRIVALAYYELGDNASAELWIRSLMSIDRNYRADSDEPQFFRDRVVIFRPKAWHRKRWVRVGGVAVVGGVIGLVVLSRTTKATPLTTPPPWSN